MANLYMVQPIGPDAVAVKCFEPEITVTAHTCDNGKDNTYRVQQHGAPKIKNWMTILAMINEAQNHLAKNAKSQ